MRQYLSNQKWSNRQEASAEGRTVRRYMPYAAGKAQPKPYADSLTLTGKGEKDYLDVMNSTNRVTLSPLGNGGEVRKERTTRWREPFQYVWFNKPKHPEEQGPVLQKTQAFYHRDNYFPVFQPTFIFWGGREKSAAIFLVF